MVEGSWTCVTHLFVVLSWRANHVHFVFAVVGCPNAQKMTDLWTMHRWDIWLHSGRFLMDSIILHHFLLRSSGSSLCKVKAWHMAVLEAPRLSCSLQRDPRQIAFIIKQSEEALSSERRLLHAGCHSNAEVTRCTMMSCNYGFRVESHLTKPTSYSLSGSFLMLELPINTCLSLQCNLDQTSGSLQGLEICTLSRAWSGLWWLIMEIRI